MRFSILATLLALVLPGVARTDDAPKPKSQSDRERTAKAALAIAAASDPEKCECAKTKILPWADASAKGLKDKKPVVVFTGGIEPRCCGDAIPAKLDKFPAGVFTAGTGIVVYAPDGGTWKVIAELPGDATRKQIEDGVKKAAAYKP
jgi:hypothetical protein